MSVEYENLSEYAKIKLDQQNSNKGSRDGRSGPNQQRMGGFYNDGKRILFNNKGTTHLPHDRNLLDYPMNN